jgi:hypothetical protein
MAKYIEDCPKCSTGKGYISYFAYHMNGVCFKCEGSGVAVYSTSPEARAKARAKSAEKREALEAKRVAAAAKRNAERDARKAELEAKWAAEAEIAAPVPTGRVAVKGKVLMTKTVDGYAYNTLVYKMLVKDDSGFKVFGTVPSSISRVSKGDVVEFTATLEPSKDDPKFGFYKRPSKAVAHYAEDEEVA